MWQELAWKSILSSSTHVMRVGLPGMMEAMMPVAGSSPAMYVMSWVRDLCNKSVQIMHDADALYNKQEDTQAMSAKGRHEECSPSTSKTWNPVPKSQKTLANTPQTSALMKPMLCLWQISSIDIDSFIVVFVQTTTYARKHCSCNKIWWWICVPLFPAWLDPISANLELADVLFCQLRWRRWYRHSSVQLLQLVSASCCTVCAYIRLSQVKLGRQVLQLGFCCVMKHHGFDTSQNDILGCIAMSEGCETIGLRV